MARQVNDEGLALIQRWEGLRLEAYRDVGGVLTIGYGSTGPHVRPGMTITEHQADELLRADLERFETAVDRLVKVSLTDNQFAALVSLAFNIGVGAFQKSTLLKRLNAGNYDAVPAQFMVWNKVKGKVVQGLVNRRAAECGLWAKGEFVASNTVEPDAPKPTTGKGGVLGGAAVVVVGTIGAAQQITEATQKLGDSLAPSFGDYAPYVTPAVLFIVLVGFGAWWASRARKRQQEAA